MHINMVFFQKNSLTDRILSLTGRFMYGIKGILPDEITLVKHYNKMNDAFELILKSG
jgi:hypothetical protein